MRCPKCGDRDNLALTEVHEEVGTTDCGRIEIAPDGLVAPSVFWFSPGDPVRVLVTCFICRHEWRPRTQLVAWRPEEPDG